MSARVQNGSVPESRWTYKVMTLKSGQIAYQGSQLFLELSSLKLTRTAAGNVPWCVAAEKVDASLADASINVKFPSEKVVQYWVNGTSSDAIASTDVGKFAYFKDDQTVSILSSAGPLAGKIVDVDTSKGIGIEPMLAWASPLAQMPAAGSFTANDFAPADIINGAVYAVPTTGAASTITLPAAAQDGTVAYFAADGSANAHTVQYRDVTGSTNLTTALTASKRHLVVVSKLGGKWFANAYVSP